PFVMCRRLPRPTLFPYPTLFRSLGAANPEPAVPHPLDPSLRDPAKMRGWLRIGPITAPAGEKSKSLRIAVFNAAAAINATTVIQDRKSTRLNSSHLGNSYAVFCL